jgi:hypothetical protein
MPDPWSPRHVVIDYSDPSEAWGIDFDEQNRPTFIGIERYRRGRFGMWELVWNRQYGSSVPEGRATEALNAAYRIRRALGEIE